MENKEIELTSDLMVTSMDSTMESSGLNNITIPNDFVISPEYLDDSEKNQMSADAKERNLA